LTLVVTAADLRVAQGFVRCGRCSNVFNALARLSEDRTGGAAGGAPPRREPEPSAPAPKSAPQEPEEADTIPDSALEFDPEATDVSKVFVEQTPDPQWSAATGKFKALLRKIQPQAPSPQGASEPPADRARQPKPDAPQAAPQAARQAAPQTPQPTPPSRAASSLAAREPTSTAPPASSPKAPASSPKATPAAAPQTIPTDEDAQFDIEVDAEFLAATVQLRPQPPSPPATPPPATPPPAAPQKRTPGAPGSPGSSAATAPSEAVGHDAEAQKPSGHPASRESQDVGVRDSDLTPDTASVEEMSEPEVPAGARATRMATPHLWWAGTGVLGFLLAIQIIHHYRHDLATNEHLYKPLTQLYSALGIPLTPRWNLEAYDVRQLGASADNASSGQLTVRASVKNTAKQPQPLPLLRVTLQDRYGNRIAARDVPPKSYLPSAIPASSFLSAGQRIDAEMAFVDPGSNAVGFEIDACLPEPGGTIACANDAGAR